MIPCYGMCFMHESTQLTGHVATELTAPASDPLRIVGAQQHKGQALIYLSWKQNYTRCKAPMHNSLVSYMQLRNVHDISVAILSTVLFSTSRHLAAQQSRLPWLLHVCVKKEPIFKVDIFFNNVNASCRSSWSNDWTRGFKCCPQHFKHGQTEMACSWITDYHIIYGLIAHGVRLDNIFVNCSQFTCTG